MASLEDLEKKINGVVTDMKTRDTIVFNNRKDAEDNDHEYAAITSVIAWICVIAVFAFIGFVGGYEQCVANDRTYLIAHNATMLATWVTG